MEDPAALMRGRRFRALVVLASLIGLVVSIAAWAFLQLVFGIEEWVFTDIPHELGYDSTPLWWYPPVVTIAGLVTAFAIVRLAGQGGHVPGVAYAVSLGGFRGGPVFPALFLGAGAGLMAAKLPGFSVTPAVAVGIGAAVVSVLRLPLAAVVLAVLVTAAPGPGAAPLIIVGVVVAYLTTLALSAGQAPVASPAPQPS